MCFVVSSIQGSLGYGTYSPLDSFPETPGLLEDERAAESRVGHVAVDLLLRGTKGVPRKGV